MLGIEDKAAMEPGFVLFVRAVLFPSLIPSQAALSVSECPEALVIFPDCFMHLSLKEKKKGGGEEMKPELHAGQKDSYLL